MKVKELIEELKKFDGEKSVLTEGCDCDGIAGKVEEYDGFTVIITRDGREYAETQTPQFDNEAFLASIPESQRELLP